jgi:hypothetical protein
MKFTYTIRKGEWWIKTTSEWYGDLPAGSEVRVVKYENGWVWYKTNLFGQKYVLNEWSFRRIFKHNQSNQSVEPYLPEDYAILKYERK